MTRKIVSQLIVPSRQRRFLTFLLALIVGTGTLLAESGTCGKDGDNLTWDLTNGVLTISGTGEMADWISNVAVPWYPNQSSIQSVVIGNGVTSIGNSAFSGFSSLTTITIPSGITRIGEGAFLNCTALTSLMIPKGVTSIGGSFFNGCTNLVSITVESGNTKYDSRDSCNAIIETATNELINGCKSTVIPGSVTSIKSWAFAYCSGLTSIDIPNSVTNIGADAFYECNDLTSVTIGESVTSIGEWAFAYCSSLKSIDIPNSVTSIERNVFYECKALSSLTVGKSLTSIGKDAFFRCKDLTSIVWNAKNCNRYNFGSQVESFIFGDEVESIPDSCCYCMTKLTSLDIPNSVTSIGGWAFYSCSGLTSLDIPNSVTRIGRAAFGTCSRLASLTIPNGIISIGGYTFSGCSSLTSISIPESVDTIGEYAFAYCKGLTSITCEAVEPPVCGSYAFDDVDKSIPVYVPNKSVGIYKNAPVWNEFTNFQTLIPCEPLSGTCGAEGDNLTWTLSCDGVLTISGTGDMAYYKFRNYIPWYDYRENIISVVISEGVTNIEDWIFREYSALTSVTIPNTVTSIGTQAFYLCTALTSIDIPNSVTSIGDYAFYKCSQMTSVTLPNSITIIHDGTFRECKALTSITIPNSVDSIGQNAFDGCIGLKSITCEAVVPPVCGKNCFDQVNKSIPVYVPAESLEAYKNAPGWKDFFTNFKPIEGGVIPEPETNMSLWIVPMSGEEQQFALSMIGRITFDEDHIYLHSLSGELLGERLLDSIRKIVFRPTEQESQALHNTQSGIRVYPVPARDLLIVEGVEGNKLVRVYSLQGALVTTATVNAGQAQVQVSNLPEGNYLLQAGVEIIKFIKK